MTARNSTTVPARRPAHTCRSKESWVSTGQYPPRVDREHAEQFEFRGRQLHHPPGHRHLPVLVVDGQISQYERLRPGPPAQGRPDSRRQLRRRERLDDVVGGAELQRRRDRLVAAVGGDEDDRQILERR